MTITYKVVRSVTGLTQQDLNTLGNDNWDLQTIVEEDVGYQYIFIEAQVSIEYLVDFSVTGLTEAEIQAHGNNDFVLITTITPARSIGVYYYFKLAGGGPPN